MKSTTRPLHSLNGMPQVHQNGANLRQKKWMNANRDASSIIDKQRINSVGTGSLNPNGGPLSFTTHKQINTVREAIKRVRCGGSVAPAKKGHNYRGAPIFY
jgi:hypothetical protein